MRYNLRLMSRLSFALALALGVVVLAGRGFGAVLVSETFSYPDATFLDNANGGTGWGDSWNDDSFFTDGGPEAITAPGLAYPGLATSGNRVVAEGSGSTDSRILAAGSIFGTNGTTRWMSFLMRKDANGNGGALDPDYGGIDFFGVAGTTDTNLYVGAFDTGRFGLGGDGAGAESAAPVSLGTTYFLVLKFTFVAGKDTVQLFLNPAPGGADPTNPIATKSDVNFGSIDALGIENGVNSVWSFDEIRIGDTYLDIAPIPEPGTVAFLIGGMLLVGGSRFRREGAKGRAANFHLSAAGLGSSAQKTSAYWHLAASAPRYAPRPRMARS